MSRMTEEEALALDEEISGADIALKPAGAGGIFTRQRNLIDALDRTSADYIMLRAAAANKMPLQVLSEMIHEKIAASV